jgi:hypothetical protein
VLVPHAEREREGEREKLLLLVLPRLVPHVERDREGKRQREKKRQRERKRERCRLVPHVDQPQSNARSLSLPLRLHLEDLLLWLVLPLPLE